MAQSRDISQTIRLEGAAELRRQLAAIGQVGEDAMRRTSDATGRAAVSSGQMSAALTNLSFQVNDVATSLASGGDAARVFAQQGGQIFQAVQQGGGLSSVLSAVGTSIAGMITPMRAAVVGGAALAAGFALIVARAIEAREAAKNFNIILAGVGKTGVLTGRDLVDAAARLRDVGLSAGAARTALTTALRQGVAPAELERVVRTGQRLNRVFGEGTLEEFISAVGKGGEPLRQFAERMGLVAKKSDEIAVATPNAGGAIRKQTEQIVDALRKQNEALAAISRSAQEQRDAAEDAAQQQREDLVRERGTAEEEIEIALGRRLEEIDKHAARQREDAARKHNEELADIARKRNEDAAKSLEEYNRQIDEAVEKAAAATNENARLFDEIARKAAALETPRTNIEKLTRAWGDLLDALENSRVIQGLLDGVAFAVTKILEGITNLVQGANSWGGLITAMSPVGAAITVLMPLVQGLIDKLGFWKSAVTAVGDAWNGLAGIAQGVVDGVKEIWGDIATWFDTNVTQPILKLVNDIKVAWENLKGILGFNPAELIKAGVRVVVGGEGHAAGGMIRGPGTGTSDSILARLSAGEFVTRAAAVRTIGPDVFAAMNAWPERFASMFRGFALGGPVLRALASPRPAFAGGGMALAGDGAGRGAFTLTFEGRSFPVHASGNVLRDLERHARQKALLQIGRKPG